MAETVSSSVLYFSCSCWFLLDSHRQREQRFLVKIGRCHLCLSFVTWSSVNQGTVSLVETLLKGSAPKADPWIVKCCSSSAGLFST